MVGCRRDQGDSEEDQETKSKVTPTKTRAAAATDHKKEASSSRRQTEDKQQKEEESGGNQENAEENEESEDGGELMIADDEIQEETEEDSDVSDDADDLQQYTGTMTRRQSKQLKEAGEGLPGSTKKRNRTCEYCGVVKATPAALVRHIRKHTGERPFVCKVCGKAYKAKRSLNLHENTQHNGITKNPLPSLVPHDSTTTFNITDHVQKQASPTPPISESTKSLLRETLESSRKSKDVNSITATATASSGTSSIEASMVISTARASERLSTPNLVNLLTSDISTKIEHTASSQGIPLTAGKSTAEASASYLMEPGSVKPELEEVTLKMEEEEEQAQDLSMPAKKRRKEEDLTSGRKYKCEFCSESFRDELARATHTKVAHGIIINPGHHSQDSMDAHSTPHRTPSKAKHNSVLSSTHSSFTKIEPKTSPALATLPQQIAKHHHHHHLQHHHHAVNTTADAKSPSLDVSSASFSSLLTKKMRDSHHSPVSVPSPALLEASKGDAISLAMANLPSGEMPPGQDEMNALPYYITSRMMQDFSAEELAVTELQKTVLAEDGGHRKCRMTVTKEIVLVTRLDGINNITGRQATVYKCQLCKRIFSSMIRYNNHIPTHYDTEITTYDCRYCEASFRSHIQIIKHLQCHREKFVGLNPTYVEDMHLQKKKSDLPTSDSVHPGPSLTADNTTNGIMNLSASAISPSSGKHSNSSSPQPILEPGERVNGGYPCGKCRKSFTREYLLQRHMRIHQNQSSFYCPDCESGFSGEVDLMEHRKRYHGFKATEEQQKYHNLFSSLQKAGQDHLKPSTKTGSSDSNNNNNSSSANLASSAVATSSSSNAASGVDHGFDTNRAGLYPMVDMKAIDLRHGEEVAVRMMEGIGDKSKEEILKRALSEEYNKRIMMKKVAEMTRFLNILGENQQAGKDISKEWQAALRTEQMRQMLLGNITEEERKKRLAEKAAAEEEMRKAALKKLEEEQKAKQRREDEKRRKLEQAKLKEKLAKEGMGDVMVVLPVAPSPDTANKELTSSQASGKAGGSSSSDIPQDKSTTSLATSRIEEVLEQEYGQSSSSEAVNSESVPVDKKDSSPEKSTDLSVGTSGQRRPLNPADSAGAPPAKSRRKALKPQKINHFASEDTDAKKVDESFNSSATVSSAAKEEKIKTNQCQKADSDRVKNQTDKGKTVPTSDGFSTMKGFQHLLAFRNSSTISGSDLTATKGHPSISNSAITYNPLVGQSVNSKYYNKIIAGYDASGQPIMYNSNAANSGDEGDGVAIDLSADSTKKTTSSLASNKSSSPLSSSSSSPVTTSYDIDSSTTLAHGSQRKGHQRLKSLSRSVSLDRGTAVEQDSSSQSQDYVSHSSPEAAKSDEQLSFKLALTPSQFSKAMLINATSSAMSSAANPETASLIGLPRVLWGSSSSSSSSSAAGAKTSKGQTAKTNGMNHNKSRTSSPSPVPSPTNSDPSSADGRKVTSLSRTHSSARATSLSRTHSRLSVVNEPVDRNILCKPKTTENGKSVYTCAICSKNFLSLSDINRHMDFHEDIRPYKCKYCDYYARTNSQLKVHKLRHEGVREFCCRVCNYRGVTQSDLNRHMKSQVHLLRSNHICSHCGEGFVTPKTLQDHVTSACSGTRMDCFEKSFEHTADKGGEELGDLASMEEDLCKEHMGVSEEEEEEEEEVMDLRITGLEDRGSGKEMNVVTA